MISENIQPIVGERQREKKEWKIGRKENKKRWKGKTRKKRIRVKRSRGGRAIARSEMKGEQRERRLRKYSRENCIEEKKQKKKKRRSERKEKRRGKKRKEFNCVAREYQKERQRRRIVSRVFELTKQRLVSKNSRDQAKELYYSRVRKSAARSTIIWWKVQLAPSRDKLEIISNGRKRRIRADVAPARQVVARTSFFLRAIVLTQHAEDTDR